MGELREHKLELKGMSCGSCETLVKRIAVQNGAEISSIDAMGGKVVLMCEDDKLDGLKQKFAEKGFPEKGIEDVIRGDPKRVFNYLRSIVAGDCPTEVETTLVTYSFGAVSAIVLMGAVTSIILPSVLQPVIAMLPLTILLIFGILMMLFSYYHLLCYRQNLSCANGMMVGMTVGMMGGFLAGALVGATNGMFVGSLVGMAFGIFPGFALGRYCGVMGAMEAIMAGIMAGTMGAMLSVMMINDNLLVFLYILFALCAVIIGSLSYMMYREACPALSKNLNIRFSEFAVYSFVLTVFFLAIMIFGPKNGIVLY